MLEVEKAELRTAHGYFYVRSPEYAQPEFDLYVKVDDFNETKEWNLDGFQSKHWRWIKLFNASYDVTAGNHTLTVRQKRFGAKFRTLRFASAAGRGSLSWNGACEGDRVRISEE
jgi:hypothetical protein